MQARPRPRAPPRTSRATAPASSPRRRRLARSWARRSRSASSRLASTKPRSVALRSSRWCSAQSAAASSRAPRYRSDGSRPPASQRRAAAPSCRCRRMPVAVLVEPAPQGRPLADQHLVGDLGRALAERHQPRVGEPLQQRLDDRRARPPPGTSSSIAHAPARVGDALAELGEPQEHAAHQLALVGRQRREHAVGRPGDRRRDAAALAVALDRERASVAPLPRGAQRVREQRQRARARRRRRAGPARRARARAAGRPGAPAPRPRARARRRSSPRAGPGWRRPRGRAAAWAPSLPYMSARTPIATGPAQRQQRVDERPPAAASSHSVNSSSNWSTTTSSAGSSGDVQIAVSCPGVSRRARVDAGDLARPHRRDDAGAQHRRLAAPRGADDGEQPPGRQPRRSARRRPPRGRRSSRGPRARRRAGRGTGNRSPEAGR